MFCGVLFLLYIFSHVWTLALAYTNLSIRGYGVLRLVLLEISIDWRAKKILSRNETYHFRAP
jgi:hypothetical protein